MRKHIWEHPEEFFLSASQKKIFDELLNNWRGIIFLFGVAGTGKTFLLRQLMRHKQAVYLPAHIDTPYLPDRNSILLLDNIVDAAEWVQKKIKNALNEYRVVVVAANMNLDKFPTAFRMLVKSDLTLPNPTAEELGEVGAHLCKSFDIKTDMIPADICDYHTLVNRLEKTQGETK